VWWSECVRWVGPVFGWVQPCGTTAKVLWFPLVACTHMRVQEGIGVAEDLKIDPPESRITTGAYPLDSLAKQVHVSKELQPAATRKVGKPLDLWRVDEQDAVPRKELNVTDGGEPRGQSAHHGGVFPAQRRPDPIQLPAHCHAVTIGTVTPTNAIVKTYAVAERDS
jgi:hypothetical protein